MNQEISIKDLGYTPVDKAPTQATFNGIGTRLYGKRMIDIDQNLYEKTLFFTVLFIPTFPIKKYLIQGIDGNEYVIAKKNLSGFARYCNICFFLFVAALILYACLKHYISSPGYIAKKNYNTAVNALEKNEPVTVLYHGKVKGVIVPAKSDEKAKKVTTHPFFGSSAVKEQKTVLEELDDLRGSRFNDI